MVMPEIGFELVPMTPTMRDDTVTKKNPKTTIITPSASLPSTPPGMNGQHRHDEDEHEAAARGRR